MKLSKGLVIALSLALSQASFSQFDGAKPPISVSQIYIVKFVEPGLLYYTGGQGGLRGTAPEVTGSRTLDARSPAAEAYGAFLANKQQAYLSQIAGEIGRPVDATQNYTVTLNGVALRLTAEEAAKLNRVPGVASVEAERIYQLDTDAGPAWIGAPAVWTGNGVVNGTGTKGQGVVIGTFDSGINADHPSFANDASCGHTPANPKLLSAKDCLAANCVGGDPEDTSATSSGHGVHTASTSGGNALNTPLTVGGVALRYNISGVAPCATVRSYKVCGSDTCSGAAILAAVQNSIIDQVKVVNFSISGGTDPWNDNDRNFLDMVNADILVAASAGNTRAAPNNIPVGAVNHRGPWMLNVANSTHDRVDGNPVSVAGGPAAAPGVAGDGLGYTSTVTAQVASAALLGNEFGCTATGGFPAGSMTGRIAIIQRGPLPPGTACGFLEKINNASAAGAIAAVLYNHSAGPPPGMGNAGTTIPSVIVARDVGFAIRDFIAANTTAQMTVAVPSVRLLNPAFGDILNASSLRGPNIVGTTTVGTNTYIGSDTTKPDITGPGTNVYAAVSDVAGQFGFLTGTSMSSPHLAGSAALVRAAQPAWTVPEVKSALMLTAKVTGSKPDAVTAWDADDVGNGRVDLNRAALAGFVMHETFANFLAANPTGPSDQTRVRALNLASMRNTSCAGTCVFTRVLRNTRSTPSNWTSVTTGAPAGTTVTVAPASWSFNGSLTQTQTVTITVRINQVGGITGIGIGDVRFNGVLAPVADPNVVYRNGFENPQPAIPEARMTIAVTGTQAP